MSIPIIANPLCHQSLSLEDGIRLVLSVGFDHIELCRGPVAPCKTPQLRQQLRGFVASLGSKIVGFNVPDQDYFQALNSPDDFAPALEGLKGDIDKGSDLGVDYVLTFEGRVPAGASADAINGPIFDSTCSLLQQANEYAAAKGIELVVEVHPFTLGIDVDWLCRLCDTIGDNFGVAYDPCHFGVGSPDSYLEAIGKLGSRIKCVHFSDSDKISSELHFPPGKGCLDLDGILNELKGIDFRGSWMVDYWLYPLPEEAARSGLAFLREALKDFDHYSA
jgi:sugar phosphate isomerase/epimerase